MIVSIRDLVAAGLIAFGAALITLSQVEPANTSDPWMLGFGVFFVGMGAHL
jgi:hypothetical protein